MTRDPPTPAGAGRAGAQRPLFQSNGQRRCWEKTPRHPFDAQVAARALWQATWELALPLVMGVSVLAGWATMIEGPLNASVPSPK